VLNTDIDCINMLF